jgi:cysteine-rich repeat protein
LFASLLAASASCFTTNEVVCEDGRICPEGTTCQPVGDETFCAQPEQLALCATVADGAACDYHGVPSACHGGLCLPAVCGNARLDPDEMCDDGNTEPFDTCSADCRSTRVCGNGVVDADPDLDEDCDDANGMGHDGCSATCVGETLSWTQLTFERPPPVYETRLAFDSKRGRVVMFGGRQNVGAGGVLEYSFTHEWDGARWVRPPTTVEPQPRRDYQFAYDAERGVTLMFSGSTFVPDTWLWDGTSWSVASPTTIPPPRVSGTTVYDSKRKRVVMFGGRVATAPVDQGSDTWAWTGSDWVNLMPAMSPPKRQNAQMAYDPKRDRIVLYGGFFGSTSTTLGDLWEFDGTTWSKITFTGGPGLQASGAMAYDPVSEHVILIPVNGPSPTDVWDWDGTVWTKRPTASSFPIGTTTNSGATITTDTIRGRVVIWTDRINELAGSTWVAPPAGAAEDPFQLGDRQLPTLVLDTGRRHVIAYGGAQGTTTPKNDTFIWDGSWTFVVAGPTARFGASAAFDRDRGEMVMFGGCPSATTFLGDTYTFDTAWHTKTPSSPPSPRCKHAIAYDVASKQTILFGGLSSPGPLSDTFLWDSAVSNWTPLTPAHVPPARYGAAIGYDEKRDQIVMFGGRNATTELEDTWIWDAAARDWIEQTGIAAPPPRHYAQLAWDYSRARLVLYGGADTAGAGSLGDVWEWTGSAWVQAPAQDSPRLDSFGMTSGLDGGVIVFGGQTQGLGATDAVMRLRYDGPVRYETCTAVDVDGDDLAGCADSDCASRCIPCGDGTCDPDNETCGSCPQDCGACPLTCGDTTCATGEVCPGDC